MHNEQISDESSFLFVVLEVQGSPRSRVLNHVHWFWRHANWVICNEDAEQMRATYGLNTQIRVTCQNAMHGSVSNVKLQDVIIRALEC